MYHIASLRIAAVSRFATLECLAVQIEPMLRNVIITTERARVLMYRRSEEKGGTQ